MTMNGTIIFNMVPHRLQKGKYMENWENQERLNHLKTLKERITACTDEELLVIADTLVEVYPDIVLAAIGVEIKKGRETIKQCKRILEGEE